MLIHRQNLGDMTWQPPPIHGCPAGPEAGWADPVKVDFSVGPVAGLGGTGPRNQPSCMACSMVFAGAIYGKLCVEGGWTGWTIVTIIIIFWLFLLFLLLFNFLQYYVQLSQVLLGDCYYCYHILIVIYLIYHTSWQLWVLLHSFQPIKSGVWKQWPWGSVSWIYIDRNAASWQARKYMTITVRKSVQWIAVETLGDLAFQGSSCWRSISGSIQSDCSASCGRQVDSKLVPQISSMSPCTSSHLLASPCLEERANRQCQNTRARQLSGAAFARRFRTIRSRPVLFPFGLL